MNLLTEQIFAIKQISLAKLHEKYRVQKGDFMEQIQREVAVLKKIRHRNLIQLEEVILDRDK